MRVLEFSQLLPGPLCGQLLADLGADVVKIEKPGGDGFRSMPPFTGRTGSVFHILNRNKRSICLDMKKKGSAEIIRTLAISADVLLESFRPGFMGKKGLGYERLRKSNPGLVYCSLTGWGQDGPYKDRSAHEINFESVSGMLGQLGDPDNPPVPWIQIAGVGGGSLTAAMGILAALLSRARSGAGQYLDISIVNGIAPFLALSMARHFAHITNHKLASYNVYPTKDRRFLAVGSREQRSWKEFCKAVGREDLEEHLNSGPDKQKQMINELGAIFRKKKLSDWLAIFAKFDACVSAVNNLEEAANDPQIAHRGLWFTAEHSADGKILQQAFPILYWADRDNCRREPPALGEHTQEILAEIGYNCEQILKFRDAGVIL